MLSVINLNAMLCVIRLSVMVPEEVVMSDGTFKSVFWEKAS
jgi:hypothetical protein